MIQSALDDRTQMDIETMFTWVNAPSQYSAIALQSNIFPVVALPMCIIDWCKKGVVMHSCGVLLYGFVLMSDWQNQALYIKFLLLSEVPYFSQGILCTASVRPDTAEPQQS